MSGRRSFVKVIFLFICAAFLLGGCGAGNNAGVMISKPLFDSVESSFAGEYTGETGRAAILELSGRLPSFSGASTGYADFNSKFSITATDLADPAAAMGSCQTDGGEFRVVINMLTVARSLLEQKYPVITVYDKTTGIAVYRAVPGRVPKVYELPAGLKKLEIKNVRLDPLSTARAIVASERGAPDIPIARISRQELRDGMITRVLTTAASEFEAEIDRRFGGASNVAALAGAAAAAASAVAGSRGAVVELLAAVPVSRDTASAAAAAFVRLLNSRSFSSAVSPKEIQFAFTGAEGIKSFTVDASTRIETLDALFAGIAQLEKVAAPAFEPADGAGAVGSMTISISCQTPGARIFYTLDGSDPLSVKGKLYGGPFEISASATVRAAAVKTGMENSRVVSANYVIVSDPSKKLPPPRISPLGGTYADESLEVAVTTAAAGAVIIYTSDGSRPTRSNGLVYTRPIFFSANCRLRAFALLEGWADSEESSADFEFRVPEPVFIPGTGSYKGPVKVRIECSHAGATIMYSITADGGHPSDFVVYGSEEILIERSATISAFAYSAGKTSSSTAEAEYIVGAEAGGT